MKPSLKAKPKQIAVAPAFLGCAALPGAYRPLAIFEAANLTKRRDCSRSEETGLAAAELLLRINFIT